MRSNRLFQPKNFIIIALGAAIYAFGFVHFNMANRIAEGGLAGITLVLHALFGINPSLSGYVINLPLMVIGAKLFGRRSMVYTIYGTGLMYFFVYVFQKIPLTIDLQGDYLVIALVAGICAGLGSGLVFRYGGTTGGSDIIARILEERLGLQLGQALLALDLVVMLLSLTYVSVPRMMYALIASFMYSQVVHLVQNGGYAVRGVLIISDQHQAVAQMILQQLGRGATYLTGQGAYSGKDKKILYVALNPTDVRDLKKYMLTIDPEAFISILNVEEVISPDFIVNRREHRLTYK